MKFSRAAAIIAFAADPIPVRPIAAAPPNNIAADFSPFRPIAAVSPNNIAAEASHRELAGTIVLAEPIDGVCLASNNLNGPFVGIQTPFGYASRDWCKAWCEQVEPDKVVAIGTFNDDGGAYTECLCYFSLDDPPSDFEDEATFRAKYDPDAGFDFYDCTGTGCIVGADGDTEYKCYRNCAYKQCIDESGYDSCPITTTTSTSSTVVASKANKPSKSSKPTTSPGSKGAKSSSLGQSGKSNKNIGLQITGTSGIAPVTLDDMMLLSAEGSLSMPTEFNEWGHLSAEGSLSMPTKFNEWGFLSTEGSITVEEFAAEVDQAVENAAEM